MQNQLETISTIDGRYFDKTKELSKYFSEMALMKYRLQIEVEYLIALSLVNKIKEITPLSPTNQKNLRTLYQDYSYLS